MTDREVALDNVKINGLFLKNYSQYQDDFDVVLYAVMQNGLALQYASYNFCDDREIVIPAIKCGGRSNDIYSPLSFASTKLKGDKNVVMFAVKQFGYALMYATVELQKDLDIVLSAVKQNGMALQFASYDLRCNLDVIVAALNQTKHALNLVPKKVYNNPEIMHAIVKIDGIALCYASIEISNNREIVLDAIKQDPFALKHASQRLRGDPEIVLTAVKQCGTTLRFASNELCNDLEVVTTAIVQNGFSICYASEKLQKNYELMVEASRHARFDEDIINYKLGVTNSDLLKLRRYANSRIATQKTKFPVINVELNACIITCSGAISGTLIHTEQINEYVTWGDLAEFLANKLNIKYVHIVYESKNITTLMSDCCIL